MLRFFSIALISLFAFGSLVYGLAALWGQNRNYTESRASFAVKHLQANGKQATPEQVRVSAREGDITSLRLLNIAGMNFHERDADLRNAVHYAIENNQWDALSFLEQLGGDVLQKDKLGRTPLGKVIDKGRVDIAQRFIGKGASIQDIDPSLTPPLMRYLRANDFEAFDFLLKNNADPNAPDPSGKFPLQLALELGLPERAMQLIDHGAMVKGMKLNQNPIIAAIVAEPSRYHVGSEQLENLLVGLMMAGADLEAKEYRSQLSPIMLAIQKGDDEVFQLLMKLKVDTNGCVMQAIQYGRAEMLKRLVMEGGSVDVAGIGGDTPLVGLVRSGGDIGMINMLLDCGADPDQLTREGQRLLFFAIAHKRTKVTMALLNHQRRPDVHKPLNYPVSLEYRNLYGRRGLYDWYCRKVKGITPLMAGVMCQDIDVVEKLIQLGAKRHQRTAVKTFPVQMAAMHKNVPMQQLLLGAPYKDHEQVRKFVIDLSEQRVYFYKNGKLVKSSRCSTGRSGYRTRTGLFVISDKQRHKVSNIYIGAKMPYFQRFSCSDFGFHYGNTGPRFASHGCIRLPMSTAKFFFSQSKVGDRVLIRP